MGARPTIDWPRARVMHSARVKLAHSGAITVLFGDSTRLTPVLYHAPPSGFAVPAGLETRGGKTPLPPPAKVAAHERN